MDLSLLGKLILVCYSRNVYNVIEHLPRMVCFPFVNTEVEYKKAVVIVLLF